MSTDIDILLNIRINIRDDILRSVNNIINSFNLSLTENEVLDAFLIIRLQLVYNDCYIYKYKFLFDTILNDNKNMFHAIIKARNDQNSGITRAHRFVNDGSNLQVGFTNYAEYYTIISEYKTLLNHCDFETSNLCLPNECKTKINAYREEKYNGNFTKTVAII